VTRAYNFSAGPAGLPTDVLRQAQAEFLDFHGIGASIMEVSHRGKAFMAVFEQAEADLRELLAIPNNYKVLFVQGGATLQFAQVPMNLLGGRSADFIVTGTWSQKAYREAAKYGTARLLATTEEGGAFRRLPEVDSLAFDPKAAYLHLCTNETIHGIEAHEDYETRLTERLSRLAPGVPLVADMSSHILSRPLQVSRYGLIYFGAQKNVGPAGVTIVIVREDLIGHAAPTTPTLLDYRNLVADTSMINTPPTFAIYMAGLVFSRLKEKGGTAAMAEINRKKAKLLYAAIDGSDGFYRNAVDLACRSNMNVPFNLPDAELEARFVKDAEAAGLIGLKGHKSVGGIRASIYNAVSLEAVETLVKFMADFRSRNFR
jgi:phosphoserine aminotransferase